MLLYYSLAYTKIIPIHNRATITAIRAVESVLPNAKLIASFDTGFHQGIPELNFLYPVPYEWYTQFEIRKFGYHGLSYDYINRKLAEIYKTDSSQNNAIVCHLGNGISVCCIESGKSIETSLGLSSNSGIMMGTRSVDIDITIPNYMSGLLNKSIDEIHNILLKQSGLLGVSGVSSDMRELSSIYHTNSRAKLAIDLYVKNIVDAVIKLANRLGQNIKTLVFTGGIGQNSALIISLVVQQLNLLSVELDEEKNNQPFNDFINLKGGDNSLDIMAIHTDEELIICLDTIKLTS